MWNRLVILPQMDPVKVEAVWAMSGGAYEILTYRGQDLSRRDCITYPEGIVGLSLGF
jgi:hypothetical protein